MLLASCAGPVVVCDDTPEPPVDWLLVGLQLSLLLVAAVVLAWWLVRPRPPRRSRRRVLLSSTGDVLHVDGPAQRGGTTVLPTVARSVTPSSQDVRTSD